MKNFIKYNDINKIVNLDNVSNIGFISDEYKNKIIFNMNYGVTLRDDYGNQPKTISDYVYWETESLEELMELREMILSKTKDWIHCPNGVDYRIINPKQVSSVVYDEDEYKNRYKIIFNLSHTVSFKYGGTTSEFTFYKFNTKQQYEKCKEHIDKMLLG